MHASSGFSFLCNASCVLQMDQELHRELSKRLIVIRNILREVSTISVNTREKLHAEIEDASSFQSLLNAVASKLRGTANASSSVSEVCGRSS